MQSHKEQICVYSIVGGTDAGTVGSNTAEDIICYELVV
jgi:hypothetical protein